MRNLLQLDLKQSGCLVRRELCLNFNYQIRRKNKEGTKRNYRWVKRYRVSVNARLSHVANILEENACQKEKMIATVAQVGCISNVEVMSRIKTNLEQTANPEAMSSMRKSKA